MTINPVHIAVYASWAATGLGAALWMWSWMGVKDPIQKIRFLDCGIVLVFASTLLRIVTQERAMTAIDWGLIFLSPLFIAAALWRLARTGPLKP